MIFRDLCRLFEVLPFNASVCSLDADQSGGNTFNIVLCFTNMSGGQGCKQPKPPWLLCVQVEELWLENCSEARLPILFYPMSNTHGMQSYSQGQSNFTKCCLTIVVLSLLQLEPPPLEMKCNDTNQQPLPGPSFCCYKAEQNSMLLLPRSYVFHIHLKVLKYSKMISLQDPMFLQMLGENYQGFSHFNITHALQISQFPVRSLFRGLPECGKCCLV